MSGTVLSATSLTKRYGPLAAVQDLDLEVEAGEIYAFLGLNGAGKTTTVRMLLGMVRPTVGTVRLFGEPVTARSHSTWSRVGYLVETPAAYPELTVRENLDVVRRLRHLRGRACVDDALDRLDLTSQAERRARTLSLGNSQRLGLAKALLHRPELVILDEPTNGLDPAGVVQVRDLLRHLAYEQGVTVFLCSHILTEVARLATRIGIIHRGRLVRELDGPALATALGRRLHVRGRDDALIRESLTAAGHHPRPADAGGFVLTTDAAVEHPDAVAAILAAAGCPPTHLTVDIADLESYFLDVVEAQAGTHA